MKNPNLRRKPIFVLVIPRFEDIFHSFYAGEVTKGVNLAASRLNVDVLVHIVDRSDHSRWIDPSLLDRSRVDGILFADIDKDVEVVKNAIRAHMPCLVLNNVLSEPINYIAIDNQKAAIAVVENFIKLGHTKIATIAGDLTTQAGQHRLDGYYLALRNHGIEIRKSYVKPGGFLRTPAREATEALLKIKDRPTAIFAASDVMAMEAIHVIRAKRLKVPQDISVWGFDDNPLNLHSPVELATVAQPIVEMARLGLERLYQISHGKARLPVKEVLKAKLITRDSVTQNKS